MRPVGMCLRLAEPSRKLILGCGETVQNARASPRVSTVTEAVNLLSLAVGLVGAGRGLSDPRVSPRLVIPLHRRILTRVARRSLSCGTRRPSGVRGGGGEADRGGAERRPGEAAAVWRRGRGDGRGQGRHLGVPPGPDEASGDPRGRAGHSGETTPPPLRQDAVDPALSHSACSPPPARTPPCS